MSMSYFDDAPTTPSKVRCVAGYALQQKLGAGSFATVYKGVRLPLSQQQQQLSGSSTAATADVVAVKAIARTSDKLTKKVLQNLDIEIQILRTYRHRNIVCLQDVQKTDSHFYLLLEYCGGGDVTRLLRTRKTGRITEGLARRLMRDLAMGLRFLWNAQLIHRDIKPANLLLTGPLPLEEVNDPEASEELYAERQRANFPSSEFVLKIADFGFARHLQSASLAETLCGSPLYMAPEILDHCR
jgi:serine/threonine-protein kinase ULK/ATG1